MVVRSAGDNIEALFLERQRQRLRRAEVRTAAVRLAAEVQLQIADRQIRAHGQRGNGREAGGEIIAAVGLLRGVDLLVVDHDVADRRQCDDGIRLVGRLLRGIILRIGLRGLLHGVLLSGLAALAAADDQDDNKDQNNGKHAQNDPLLHLATALLLKTLEPPRLQHLLIAFKFLIFHKASSLSDIHYQYTIFCPFAQSFFQKKAGKHGTLGERRKMCYTVCETESRGNSA